MSEKGVSYQAAILPESILQGLAIDDTPDIFFNYFWEFMGVDIQNAYIEPWDFDNILDMIDIKVCEILQEYPEEEWDKIVIVQYKTYADKAKGGFVKVPIHAFHFTILWSAMKTKVYVKMCRARQGFALRQITETKGSIYQTSKYEGTMPGLRDYEQQEQKKGWKL